MGLYVLMQDVIGLKVHYKNVIELKVNNLI